MRSRRVPLLLLVSLLVGATAACNATRRELTVVFASTASDAQREAVLRSCTGAAPHATPEPVVSPTSRPGGEVRHPLVVFRIDAASDRDIARLEACLQRQPGVQGFQDSAA